MSREIVDAVAHCSFAGRDVHLTATVNQVGSQSYTGFRNLGCVARLCQWQDDGVTKIARSVIIERDHLEDDVSGLKNQDAHVHEVIQEDLASLKGLHDYAYMLDGRWGITPIQWLPEHVRLQVGPGERGGATHSAGAALLLTARGRQDRIKWVSGHCGYKIGPNCTTEGWLDNREQLRKIAMNLAGNGCKARVHNTDFLDSFNLRKYDPQLHDFNFGPELAAVQSRAYFSLAQQHGSDCAKKWIDACMGDAVQKKRWRTSGSVDNHVMALGHYHYDALPDTFRLDHADTIRARLITAIVDLCHRCDARPDSTV